MCMSSTPKAPPPQPKAPPPIDMNNVAARQAGQAARKRRAKSSGYNSTVLAQVPSSGAPKSLLGD